MSLILLPHVLKIVCFVLCNYFSSLYYVIEKNKTSIQTAERFQDIWTLSHTHCSSGKLGLYSVSNLQKLQLISDTYYWLGDIRRPTYRFYSGMLLFFIKFKEKDFLYKYILVNVPSNCFKQTKEIESNDIYNLKLYI